MLYLMASGVFVVPPTYRMLIAWSNSVRLWYEFSWNSIFAKSENVTSPIRLSDGSVSFPSMYRALISSSRNLTVSSSLSSPMLPEVSTAMTMSEPREQSADNSYNAAKVAVPMMMRNHHQHQSLRFSLLEIMVLLNYGPADYNGLFMDSSYI